MASERDIYIKFQRALNAMARRGRKEVTDQGHVASGKGRDSIEGVITNRNLNLLIGAIMTNDYMVEKVDPGVSAGQVPLSGSARQKYIRDLTDWARDVKPGLVLSERIRFAVNTHRKHTIEGNPTKASRRFAKNRRRTGWISHSFESSEAIDEFEELTDLIEIITELFEEDLEQAA